MDATHTMLTNEIEILKSRINACLNTLADRVEECREKTELYGKDTHAAANMASTINELADLQARLDQTRRIYDSIPHSSL